MSKRQTIFNFGAPIQKTVLIAGLVCAILFFFTAVRQVSAATEEPIAAKTHLVTVYDGEFEKTFVTEKDTVEQALAAEGIDLEQNDRVEPAADSELIATNYSINIYRARPVTVIDGAKRTMLLTASQSPETVVKEAEGTLYPEDITTYEQATDPLIDGGAGLKLVIDRATSFELDLYGVKLTARSQAATVGDMLAEKDITLGEKDGVSVESSAKLVKGMSIRVWRDGKQTITEEKAIKKPIEEIKDADRKVGYRAVRSEGRDGKKKVTYEVELRNGREVSRKEISSVVITEAVKEVVVVGTKQETMPYSGGGNKSDWLAASSIPESQWGYADWLVQKESGWNPNAVNVSSGACGLGQQLPCGKWAGQWNDPVDSLNGMHGYVMGRYGSWEAAVQHSKSVGWY